jgi:exosortase
MTLARKTLLFAAYCAAITAASWGTVRALYEHSQRDNTASHVVLIPLIAAGLVYIDRRRIFRTVGTSWPEAVGIFAVGLALFASASLGDAASLSLLVAPLVMFWIAGYTLFYGVAAARAALFPLLFLGFTIPFPPAVLQAANDFLKDGSTETVALLFSVTGTPHVRDDYVFRLPYIAIEVADACSGIRSSIGLLITSLLAGHLFLRTAWKKAVLLVIIVPITVLKNAVRITTLSLLSIHVDRSYLSGQLHHEGGIVFFVLSLALMAPVLFWLMRSEGPRRPSASRLSSSPLNPSVSSSSATN